MPTQKEIREFQRAREPISCPKGHLNWVPRAEIMTKDILLCIRCGECLAFDKEKWHAQRFNPPPMSIDDRINHRGRARGLR
jgi:hypothetical protein